MGEAIASQPEVSTFVTTKVPCCPNSAYYHCNATFRPFRAGKTTTDYVDDALRKLGIASVDLLLLHWPCAAMADSVKVYHEMEAILAAGKARSLGLSNFNSTEIELLMSQVRIKPTVNQVRASIGSLDEAVVQSTKQHGMKVMAYS